MPATSPGRFGRVVTETDMLRLASRSSSRREIVVLPAPDGDDSTSINPRRRMPAKPSFEPAACIAPVTPSLDVLDLLAQPLDRGLEPEADAGKLDVGRLGAQRG